MIHHPPLKLSKWSLDSYGPELASSDTIDRTYDVTRVGITPIDFDYNG